MNRARLPRCAAVPGKTDDDDDGADEARETANTSAEFVPSQQPANPPGVQLSFDPPVLISNRSVYASYSTQIDNETILFQATVDGLRRPSNDSVVYVTTSGGRSWRSGWTADYANATSQTGLIDSVRGQLLPADAATASSMGFRTAVRDMGGCPAENLSITGLFDVTSTTPAGVYRAFTNEQSGNPTTYFGVYPNGSVGRVQRRETVRYDLGAEHEVHYRGGAGLDPFVTVESGLVIRPDDGHAVKTAWIMSSRPGCQFSVVALVAPPPFVSFSFLGVVANASEGTAGVDEHDIALLPNGTIVAILNTDGEL